MVEGSKFEDKTQEEIEEMLINDAVVEFSDRQFFDDDIHAYLVEVLEDKEMEVDHDLIDELIPVVREQIHDGFRPSWDEYTEKKDEYEE